MSGLLLFSESVQEGGWGGTHGFTGLYLVHVHIADILDTVKVACANEQCKGYFEAVLYIMNTYLMCDPLL